MSGRRRQLVRNPRMGLRTKSPFIPLLTIVVMGLVAGLALAACDNGSPTGPPTINYGRDTCDRCHMIISEARYAAAWRDKSGKAQVFDDIGELLAAGLERSMLGTAQVWVHDFDDASWITAAEAWFVYGNSVETPMGGGIVAFADKGAGQKFATLQGSSIRSWSALIADAAAGVVPLP